MKNIPMVPYAAGEYIEIAQGSDIRRFVFKDPRRQIKWVMAVRQIRDKYYERKSLNEEKGWDICEDSIRQR
jgi:lipocalin